MSVHMSVYITTLFYTVKMLDLTQSQSVNSVKPCVDRWVSYNFHSREAVSHVAVPTVAGISCRSRIFVPVNVSNRKVTQISKEIIKSQRGRKTRIILMKIPDIIVHGFNSKLEQRTYSIYDLIYFFDWWFAGIFHFYDGGQRYVGSKPGSSRGKPWPSAGCCRPPN